MIASRSNVLLAFLEIYLIVGFLTIFVFSEEEEWTNANREASQKTGCISDCQGNVSVLYLLLIYIILIGKIFN